MSKVTYEEALHSLEMTRQHAVYGQAMEKEYNSSFIRNINKVEQFIEQHKPPTFDEVVKAWGDIGYTCYDSSDHIALLFIDYGNNEIAFEYMKHGRFNVTTGTLNMLYPEMLNAINLAIRYLQAKEKEND